MCVNHADFAQSLNNLTARIFVAGDYDRAEPPFRCLVNASGSVSSRTMQ